MLSRIRAHLTYANVMATVAVFFAVGGGAAYATHLIVRSSDIVNGEVRSADVANDSTASALTGVDVSNANGGSLTGLDVRESTLNGVPVSGVEQTFGTSASSSTSAKSATAFCPPGKVALGGGGEVSGATQGEAPNFTSDIAITAIAPEIDRVRATASEIGANSAGEWFVQAFAVCANAP